MPQFLTLWSLVAAVKLQLTYLFQTELVQFFLRKSQKRFASFNYIEAQEHSILIIEVLRHDLGLHVILVLTGINDNNADLVRHNQPRIRHELQPYTIIIIARRMDVNRLTEIIRLPVVGLDLVKIATINLSGIAICTLNVSDLLALRLVEGLRFLHRLQESLGHQF